MTTGIFTSLEKLHEVLKDYQVRLDHSSPVTPIPQELRKQLLTTPLEKLSEEDLSDYMSKALTTWGNDQDFKYFLPRLLEVITEDREILFSKINYARWQEWPELEQAALKNYFMEFWVSAITRTTENADTALCCLGQVLDDLSPHLKIWENYGDSDAESMHLKNVLQQLRTFVEKNQNSILTKKKLANGFWHDRPVPHQRVLDWLTAPATLRRFESRWEDRQYSPNIGADSGWLEETILVLKNLKLRHQVPLWISLLRSLGFYGF